MGKFDEIYNRLLETMTAGGEGNMLASGNGDHGNAFGGDADVIYAPKDYRSVITGGKKKKYQRKLH